MERPEEIMKKNIGKIIVGMIISPFALIYCLNAEKSGTWNPFEQDRINNKRMELYEKKRDLSEQLMKMAKGNDNFLSIEEEIDMYKRCGLNLDNIGIKVIISEKWYKTNNDFNPLYQGINLADKRFKPSLEQLETAIKSYH